MWQTNFRDIYLFITKLFTFILRKKESCVTPHSLLELKGKNGINQNKNIYMTWIKGTKKEKNQN